MKKSKRNPLVQELVRIIAGYVDMDPEDFQELFRDQELPDGFMTEFREQCRNEWEQFYINDGSWEYFEDRLKLYLGENLYNKI